MRFFCQVTTECLWLLQDKWKDGRDGWDVRRGCLRECCGDVLRYAECGGGKWRGERVLRFEGLGTHFVGYIVGGRSNDSDLRDAGVETLSFNVSHISLLTSSHISLSTQS